MNTLTESQQATAQRELKFILAKNRHGETNKTVTLDFDGTYQKIREVANG
jgi:replicative DNA helicase